MTYPGPHRLVHILALLGLLALVACSSDDDGPTAPTGPEIPSHDVELHAVADTYLDADDATMSHGGLSYLELGDQRRALVRFSLVGLSTDAVITDLDLILTQTVHDGVQPAGNLEVARIAQDDWSEGLNHADAPEFSVEPLGVMGLESLVEGQREVRFSSHEAVTSVGWEQLYANRVITLELRGPDGVAFASSEALDSTVRPRLALSYDDGVRVVLEPQAEGHTYVAFPDSNLSQADSLRVELDYYYTYLKFDLGDLPGDADVAYADLSMLAYWGHAWGGDGRVYTHLVDDDGWSESSLTYNNQPAVEDEHLGYWWLWYNRSNGYVEQRGTNRNVMLRPAVQDELDGDGDLSLRLHSPGYQTIYYDKTATEPEKRPRLTLLYTR